VIKLLDEQKAVLEARVGQLQARNAEINAQLS